MLGKRKHLALSLGLALVIALLSVMAPQPVLAAEVQVKTEEKLRHAVETAAAGDVIQVIADINLAEGALRIKHNKPLTITSKNHSVISVSGDYGMILSDGARLTLADNLKWESTALYGVAYLAKSSLTLTDQVVIRTQGTTSGIYCKEDSQVYMTGGSIEVTKADMGDAFGIMSESSSQVEVTGGSIQVTHKGSYKAWGIRVDKDSKLDMTGASITVSGASESVGIEANNSDIDVMDGTISVAGKSAAGIRVWNGILNMTDGKITADGKDAFSRGIHLIGSRLNLYGGSIRAIAAKESLGIVAEKEGLVKIHYNPSKTTQISGKTAGITLMEQSLADVAISTFLTLKGGIHDESGIMLGKLPAPLYLAAGKTGSLKLEGVQAPISYAIDPATFSQLNVKAASGNNAFTLSSPIEGRHELVLIAITDNEKNIVRLHIPVTVTQIPFSDVAPSHWALTYIRDYCVNEKGLI